MKIFPIIFKFKLSRRIYDLSTFNTVLFIISQLALDDVSTDSRSKDKASKSVLLINFKLDVIGYVLSLYMYTCMPTFLNEHELIVTLPINLSNVPPHSWKIEFETFRLPLNKLKAALHL